MRTSEERVQELHRRMEDLQWTRRHRQYVIGSVLACAACLMITIILAFSVAGLPAGNPISGSGTYTASIFTNYSALGYVVVALVAFCLGALVTVFCFRLREHMGVKKDDRKL